MKWKETETAALNAHQVLPVLVDNYFEAGRAAAKGSASPRELHKFRVRTKRFRYALEMFAPIYGTELTKRLGTLRRLQKILGQISDVYTIRKILKHDGHKQELHSEGNKRIDEFREHWNTVFDAADQLEQWTAVLSGAPNPSQKR